MHAQLGPIAPKLGGGLIVEGDPAFGVGRIDRDRQRFEQSFSIHSPRFSLPQEGPTPQHRVGSTRRRKKTRASRAFLLLEREDAKAVRRWPFYRPTCDASARCT